MFKVTLFIAQVVGVVAATKLSALPAGLEAVEPGRPVLPAAAQTGEQAQQIQAAEAEVVLVLEERLEALGAQALLYFAYQTQLQPLLAQA